MATLDLSEKKYLVGLDVSFTNMGVCRYNPENNEMLLFTGDWFDAISFIGNNMKLKDCVFVVEDASLDSSTFKALGICKPPIVQYGNYMKKIGEKSWPLPPAIDWNSIASTLSIAFRMASNVGEVKAASKLMVQMLEKHKAIMIRIPPSNRDRADKAKLPTHMLTMPTKTTQAQFEALTGKKMRCSEHARDASTLVWGKSFKWAEMMLMRTLEDKAAITRAKNSQKSKGATLFDVVGGKDAGRKVIKMGGKFVFADETKSNV